MALDYDRLMQLVIPPLEQTFTERDAIIYALGIGIGQDPLDESQLRFVYEKNMLTMPTMAAVLGYMKVRDLPLGINYLKAVHGEQGLRLHKTLPASGTFVSKMKVTEVIDRGAEKGAVIYLERSLTNKATGELLATLPQALFCRGDGGFGGPARTAPAAQAIPERAADVVCDLPTVPWQALVYRLSGDVNPLHAEPAVAKQAGFERPILHGLATFGIVGHAVVKGVCGYDPTKLVGLEGRFSSPVLPGDTIRTELWRDGNIVTVRSSVPARNVVVFNNGRAEIKA